MMGKLAGAALAAAVVLALPPAGLRADTADLPAPGGAPILIVEGEIARSNAPEGALLDLDLLLGLPSHRIETETFVTDGVQSFEGVLVRDLLDFVGATGDTVRAYALNDYIVDIPIEDFLTYDVILAHRMNGAPLSRGKGPLWIVYPSSDHPVLQDVRYNNRWVWQLQRMDVRR